MGKSGQESERKDLEHKKRPGWQEGEEAERSGKAAVDQPPKGLRSQGEVDVVAAAASNAPQEGMGKRREPTRHDAMKIAGHERLPGYDAPLQEGAEKGAAAKADPKHGPRVGKGVPELEPMAKPEVPDIRKSITLEAGAKPEEPSENLETEGLDDAAKKDVGEPKERQTKAHAKEASEAEEAQG